MPLLYTLTKLVAGPPLRLIWRPEIDGLEHVPSNGGAILAGNHLSIADEVLVAAAVRRPIAFWAKAEYFDGAGLRGRCSRAVVNGMGAIRVQRGGGRAALAAFDAAIPVLRGGGLVAVYPEGTRSPDGRLYRGRTGTVRLAMAAGVPIVPVGAIGTDVVLPIDARLPRVAKVAMRFGSPIEVGDRGGDPGGIREVTDELMAAIQALSGQEYVPRYAPMVSR